MKTICIATVKDNAISLALTLREDHIVKPGVNEDDPPQLLLRIEEPERRANVTFTLALAGITDPEILNSDAIHHPAEMQLSFFVIYGSIMTLEAEFCIPRADEPIKR